MGVSAAPRSPEKSTDQPRLFVLEADEAGSQDVPCPAQLELNALFQVEGLAEFKAPRQVVDAPFGSCGRAGSGHPGKLHGIGQHGVTAGPWSGGSR